MKITGGSARGIPLKVVGNLVRPSTDRVRESLFSTLATFLPEAQVLDLFAGTGALGLEALSRGATAATLVEKNPKGMAALKENAAKSGFEAECSIVNADVRTWLKGRCSHEGFHLIFADPPYAKGGDSWAPELGELILRGNWLSDDGLWVFERASKDNDPVPKGWELIKERVFGDTAIWILEPA